jgi:hypothetical protein
VKLFLKLIAVAAAVRVLTLVAIPTAALAGEYCLTNTPGMRGCGFATVQQCLDSLLAPPVPVRVIPSIRIPNPHWRMNRSVAIRTAKGRPSGKLCAPSNPTFKRRVRNGTAIRLCLLVHEASGDSRFAA